jgi:ABC-2 type transport system permease protein
VALAGPPVILVLLTVAYAIGAVAGALPVRLDGGLLEVAARSMLVSAIWGLLGVAVGAVVRNQSAAMILPLLWLLVIEGLLPAYGLSDLVRWLPGGATEALSGAPPAGALPVWAALPVLAGYVLVLLVPGAAAIARRDIT